MRKNVLALAALFGMLFFFSSTDAALASSEAAQLSNSGIIFGNEGGAEELLSRGGREIALRLLGVSALTALATLCVLLWWAYRANYEEVNSFALRLIRAALAKGGDCGWAFILFVLGTIWWVSDHIHKRPKKA